MSWQTSRSALAAPRGPAGAPPSPVDGLGIRAPFLVVFAFALVAPIGYAIYLSLFREQLIGGNSFVAFGTTGRR